MINVYDKNGQIKHNNFLTAKLIILVRPTSNELNEIEKAIGRSEEHTSELQSQR